MFFPVYWVLNTSFKPAPEILRFDPTFFPHGFTFDNFKSAFNAPFFKHVQTGLPLVAPGTELLRALLESAPDGLVVARSAFESSIHYRSAVLFGSCTTGNARSSRGSGKLTCSSRMVRLSTVAP